MCAQDRLNVNAESKKYTEEEKNEYSLSINSSLWAGHREMKTKAQLLHEIFWVTLLFESCRVVTLFDYLPHHQHLPFSCLNVSTEIALVFVREFFELDHSGRGKTFEYLKSSAGAEGYDDVILLVAGRKRQKLISYYHVQLIGIHANMGRCFSRQ